MNVKTLAGPVTGDTYTLLPATGTSGITVNGMPAEVSNVAHHGPRVDIQLGSKMAFIIEHPLATLGLCGIHVAAVVGNRTRWDFFRPADREAFARRQDPGAVLGPADGSIGAGLLEATTRAGLVDTGVERCRWTVATPVDLVVDGGNRVSLLPLRAGADGIEATASLLGVGPVTVRIDATGMLVDETGRDIRREILSARSAAAIGPCRESLLHAIGDLVADVTVLGGITDGIIDARLGLAYHRATVGLVKRARATGKIVPVGNQ